MRRACALIPLLLAGPAMAACPDRLDLMQGIVLVQNGEHFRRADVEDTARGLMEVRGVQTRFDMALEQFSEAVRQGRRVQGDSGAIRWRTKQLQRGW